MTTSAQDLVAFLEASPTPFHCVEELARRLTLGGFTWVDLAEPLAPAHPGDRLFVTRGGTAVAWVVGEERPDRAGFRLLGAHTDSPNVRLKPRGELVREGLVQWELEPYGGLIAATWTDRDLGLAGRVVVRSGGGTELRLVRVDRPLARIANLAIHLNREVNEKGLVLNLHDHLPATVAVAREGEGARLEALLAASLGVEPVQVLGWDLMLFDLAAPTLGGLDQEFVYSARLDDQACCHMALQALSAVAAVPRRTCVGFFFDHEECGSQSDRGAASAVGRDLLARILRSQGGEELEVALLRSFLVSADMAHAVHPAFPGKHGGQHKVHMNGGPVIKQNVNTRYATDAVGASVFRGACAELGVPLQEYVHRSDLVCGSTIGSIAATRLACPTVDVGCAMLSMHSVREQCGAADGAWMEAAMGRCLEAELPRGL